MLGGAALTDGGSHRHHDDDLGRDGVSIADDAEEPTGWVERVRLNSWFRLFVYCLACLTTSCLYFGWQAYASLIIKSGAYSWECGVDSLPTEDEADPALCLEQSKRVSKLYAIANGSEFAFAAVAGIMLDTFGPKVTASSGELLQLLSIVLLIFAQKSFQVYPLAMVLTGACVNIICFPALSIMEQWPNRQAFAVSVIVGSQSAASVVAPILKWISDRHPTLTFKQLWGYWLLIIWLPVTSIYVWTLPRSRDYAALLKPTAGEQLGEQLGESNHRDQLAQPGAAGRRASAVSVANSLPSVSASVPASALMPPTPLSAAHGRAQWRDFWNCLKTVDIWVMALFCGSLMFQFAYYPAVVKDAISMKMSDLVGWLTPLQGPFSFVIGFIMDYTGTTLVMLVMGLTLIFVNLSCAWGSDLVDLQRLVAIWFIFVQSATYNVKYTFVNEMYDPFNFGKLVGVLGVAGGIGVYCSNPLVDLTNYSTVFTTLTIVAAFMLLLTAFIFLRQYKGITHKTLRAVDQKHRHVNNV